MAPLALGLLAALLALPAHAEPSHGALRTRLGPPSAPHSMRGVDAKRSGQSASVLGAEPRVGRRLRVALGVGRGVVALADGGFFLVHPSPRASRFDARGKQLYTIKLHAEASSPPVVTSAGSFAFAAGGELYLVDPSGRLRSRTALGEGDPSVRSILPTRDGGVLLTSYGALIKVSAFGELLFRRSLADAPVELLETPSGVLSVTTQGHVFRLDAAGGVTRLGDLGGSALAAAVSAAGDFLFARTGPHRLGIFDLHAHRLRGAVDDASLGLDGPVLYSQGGVAHAFTTDGLVVRYDTEGNELQRVAFDPGARKAPGPEQALLLGDGRLLLAREGADIAVVSQSGEVGVIASSACPDPVGLYAAGARAVLLACRSGNVLGLE
jgi:hypothetical protein